MSTPTVFEGVRVVDFTQGFAGALVTMVMADNGATVTHIEPPPDSGRPADPSKAGAGYRQWQRGKETLALDLKDPQDAGRARQLAHEADVLVEAFRPGVMDRLGLGYEPVAQANPSLVYCSITGFGTRGKYQNVKGYEAVVAAVAGRLVDEGNTFGLGRPAMAAAPIASFGASQAALQGISAALYIRLRTGVGQRVETSLLQGLTPYDMGTWLPSQVPEVAIAGARGPTPMLGYIPARAKDGRWIQFANHAPHLFWAQTEALGLGHLKNDPRFSPLPRGATEENQVAFWEMVLERVQEKSFDEWMEIFMASGNVGADLLGYTEDGMDHPQVRHNGGVVEVKDPEVGPSEQIGPLVRFDGTPSEIGWEKNGAPALEKPRSTGPLPPNALSGVVVLEAAVQYAAPFGPTLLADLGARVIKIEPTTGDTMREIPSLAVKTTQGKESIAIDLKRPEGQQIAQKLAERAHLLMHNYRPGVTERLGIDYETLHRINPRLVYLYAGLYGSDGPHCRRPGYHPIPGAICGEAVQQAGEEYLPPADAEMSMEELKQASMRLGQANQSADPNSAVVVGTAMLLGLLGLERHGIGQHMLTTMVNSNAYTMSDDFIRYTGKPSRKRIDSGLFGMGALYRLYQAAEGWVLLACPTEPEWASLCEAVDEPALADDERFATAELRDANDGALSDALAGIFLTKTAEDWESLLTSRNVACVRADGLPHAKFFGSDPSVRENGFLATVTDPVYGPIWRHGHTVHLSKTPGKLGRSILIGEHTRTIMNELGYTDSEVTRLKEQGVINYP